MKLFIPLLLSLHTCAFCQYDFCGEDMPPVCNERFLSISKRQSRNIDRNLKLRIVAFFPYIEAKLQQYGIPDDFKYLPIVESKLLPGITSTVGAKGYWQFMPATAKEMGLQTGYADDRLNFEKSTNAACRYIKRLYNRLGNWTLTAAAYNFGPVNIAKSLQKQKVGNYYYLKLNPETGEYVYRIMAYKYILKESSFLTKIKSAPSISNVSSPYNIKVDSKNPVVTNFERLEIYFNNLEFNYSEQEEKNTAEDTTLRTEISVKALSNGTFEIGEQIELRLVNEVTIYGASLKRNTILSGQFAIKNKAAIIQISLAPFGINKTFEINGLTLLNNKLMLLEGEEFLANNTSE